MHQLAYITLLLHYQIIIMAQTSTTLRPETRIAIIKIADKENRSVSEMIQILLEEALKKRKSK